MREQMYALCDPDTGEIRYIGKANDAQQRLARHRRDMRRRNTPVYCWMRKLAGEGKQPTMQLLATAVDSWQELERALIAQYRADGARLLNLADGGDQPGHVERSPERQREIARKAVQTRESDPHKLRIWRLKREMAVHLRILERMGRHESVARVREKLRQAAATAPQLFGQYA